jgi:hypothetical protein
MNDGCIAQYYLQHGQGSGQQQERCREDHGGSRQGCGRGLLLLTSGRDENSAADTREAVVLVVQCSHHQTG